MYKKHKVILLPTEDHSNIWSNKGRRLYYNQANFNDPDEEERYHLYVLSEDGIMEGDWFYNKSYGIGQYVKIDNVRLCYKFNNLTTPNPNLIGDKPKKILATTNKSLSPFIKGDWDVNETIGSQKYYHLPQIPKSFIKKYCEKGGIDKIQVEYERYQARKIGYTQVFWEEQLKISSDNTISIKPIKDSWSREEVEELLEGFRKFSIQADNKSKKCLDVFIKQNL